MDKNNYLGIGIFSMSLLSVYFGIAQYILFHIIIFGNLLTNSIYYFEGSNKVTKAVLRYMLRKWIVYGLFCIIEYILDHIFYYLPFTFLYYLAKFLLLIWVIYDESCIIILYESIILPIYNKYGLYATNAIRYQEDIKAQIINLYENRKIELKGNIMNRIKFYSLHLICN